MKREYPKNRKADNPNKEAIFDSFIKLNTCGKPMAKKHIDYVKKLMSEL